MVRHWFIKWVFGFLEKNENFEGDNNFIIFWTLYIWNLRMSLDLHCKFGGCISSTVTVTPCPVHGFGRRPARSATFRERWKACKGRSFSGMGEIWGRINNFSYSMCVPAISKKYPDRRLGLEGGEVAAEMDRFPKVNPIWKLDRFRFVGAQYVWKFWRSMIGLSLFPCGEAWSMDG